MLRKLASVLFLAAGACILACGDNSAQAPKPGSGGTAPAASPAPAPNLGQIVVFAAASMTDAVNELGASYEKRTGVPIKINAGASSTLAKQIEAGAHADVFISASPEWMDYLAQRKLLADGAAKSIAGNSLVLVAPADTKIAPIMLAPGFDFPGAFKGRLAVGDPTHVPAGKYAKEALTHFGWYAALEPRLLPCIDVRETLAAVERGEVELGIVYGSDAVVAGGKVRTLAVFPEDSHAPVVYPAAVCRDDKQPVPPDAEQFLNYLAEPDSQAVFKKLGFAPPPGK